MSPPTPQLDRSEMAAAERANAKVAEETIITMAKLLRQNAKQYSPKLRKALSDPSADTKVDISFGNEKLYSASLDSDSTLKETKINKISDAQALQMREALSKHKGENLDNPGIRDMRVLVNGEPLFEMKDGKVTQNDLPVEFRKTIASMVQPKPLEVSLTTNPQDPKSPQPQHSESRSGANAGQKTPGPQQEQLNRQFIAEARKSLDRLAPDQPAGNREWKHDKYTISEKNGRASVFVAETKETVTQQGDTVTGNARQKDVTALKGVNAALDQQKHQAVDKGMEAEL